MLFFGFLARTLD